MKPHAHWLLLGLLLAGLGALLLGPFTHQLELTVEAERDLLRTHALLYQGIWPDHGPRVAPLSIYLPPGWYWLTAPVVWLQPLPIGVHVFHSLVLLLGLGFFYDALRREAGFFAALCGVLAFGTSHFVADLLSRVWHPGLLPGLALIWLWACRWVLRAASARRRIMALAGLWGLQLLMMQSHLSAAAFAIPAAFLHGRLLYRERLARHRLAHAFALGLFLLVIWAYLRLWLAIDWDEVQQIMSSRTGGALGPTLAKLSQVLVSAFSHPPVFALSAVISALALFGTLDAIRHRRPLGLLLTGTFVVSLPLVVGMSGIYPSARYFSPLVIPLYGLATLGLGALLQRPRLPTWMGAPVLAALVVVALVGNPWAGHQDEAARDLDSLSLQEQQRVMIALRQRLRLRWYDLNTRVHGPLFGYSSAVRYLALALGYLEPGSHAKLAPDQQVTVWTEQTPRPADAHELVRLPGAGRAISILIHPRRFDPARVRAWVGGRPCAVFVPFHPAAPSQEAEAFGMRGPSAPSRCGDGPLELRLPEVFGRAPLHVVVSYRSINTQEKAPETKLQAWDEHQQPLAVQAQAPGRRFQVFTVPAAPTMRFSLSPVRGLDALDIY